MYKQETKSRGCQDNRFKSLWPVKKNTVQMSDTPHPGIHLHKPTVGVALGLRDGGGHGAQAEEGGVEGTRKAEGGRMSDPGSSPESPSESSVVRGKGVF